GSGVPRLRVLSPNTRCLKSESRAAGDVLCFETNTQMRSRVTPSRLAIRASRKQSQPLHDVERQGDAKEEARVMSGRETVQPAVKFVAFVGIDWADQKHVWCLQAAGSTERESGELEHRPETVEAWGGELCRRFGPGPIPVAVEQVKGALVCMPRKYECLHLFPVPSTMSAAMRKALYPSGAKDDPRDADLLLDLLVQHRERLRHLQPDNEETRRVQNLVEERRKLVEEKTAHVNRLIGYLKIYFPQMLEWFGSWDTKLVCEFWERGLSWEEQKKFPPPELRNFSQQRQARHHNLTKNPTKGIAQATPAIEDRAVIE